MGGSFSEDIWVAVLVRICQDIWVAVLVVAGEDIWVAVLVRIVGSACGPAIMSCASYARIYARPLALACFGP